MLDAAVRWFANRWAPTEGSRVIVENFVRDTCSPARCQWLGWWLAVSVGLRAALLLGERACASFFETLRRLYPKRFEEMQTDVRALVQRVLAFAATDLLSRVTTICLVRLFDSYGRLLLRSTRFSTFYDVMNVSSGISYQFIHFMYRHCVPPFGHLFVPFPTRGTLSKAEVAEFERTMTTWELVIVESFAIVRKLLLALASRRLCGEGTLVAGTLPREPLFNLVSFLLSVPAAYLRGQFGIPTAQLIPFILLCCHSCHGKVFSCMFFIISCYYEGKSLPYRTVMPIVYVTTFANEFHLVHDEEFENEQEFDSSSSASLPSYVEDTTQQEVVSQAMAERLSDEVCAVCQAGYDVDESVRTLMCKHYFHSACVESWLARHYRCPLCRQPLLSDNSAESEVSAESDYLNFDMRSADSAVLRRSSSVF